eukprot:2968071-Prymnesium_polylepis.1
MPGYRDVNSTLVDWISGNSALNALPTSVPTSSTSISDAFFVKKMLRMSVEKGISCTGLDGLPLGHSASLPLEYPVNLEYTFSAFEYPGNPTNAADASVSNERWSSAALTANAEPRGPTESGGCSLMLLEAIHCTVGIRLESTSLCMLSVRDMLASSLLRQSSGGDTLHPLP